MTRRLRKLHRFEIGWKWESKSRLAGAGMHIKVDTYIPPWISHHSIPSDQLLSTSNFQFCHHVPPSSVCFSLIPQRELPGYSAQHSSTQSSSLCSSVWWLLLIQAAETKIQEVCQWGEGKEQISWQMRDVKMAEAEEEQKMSCKLCLCRSAMSAVSSPASTASSSRLYLPSASLHASSF